MGQPHYETFEVEVTGCGPYSCCLLTMIIDRVRRMPGVARASVKVFPLSFLTKTLVITYEPEKIAAEQIARRCEL